MPYVTLTVPLLTPKPVPTIITPNTLVVAVATLIVPLDTEILVPTCTIPFACVVAVGKSAATSDLKLAFPALLPLLGPANTVLTAVAVPSTPVPPYFNAIFVAFHVPLVTVPTVVIEERFFVVIIAYVLFSAKPAATAGKLYVSYLPVVLVLAVELGLY